MIQDKDGQQQNTYNTQSSWSPESKVLHYNIILLVILSSSTCMHDTTTISSRVSFCAHKRHIKELSHYRKKMNSIKTHMPSRNPTSEVLSYDIIIHVFLNLLKYKYAWVYQRGSSLLGCHIMCMKYISIIKWYQPNS